jgi:hypothetical protein
MSEVTSYIDESAVDLVARGYNHMEALLTFCRDNGIALDHVETAATSRLVDDALKAELRNNKPLFPTKQEPRKKEVIVNSGQNMVDLALQETGSVEGLLAILRNNDYSAGADPVVGSAVKVMSTDVVDAKIRDYYSQLRYRVNTGDAENTEGDGIGYMIIEDDFIVT